jgi:hypothetical protein
MRHLHAPLQLCETGDLAVKRKNLAICDVRSGFLLTNASTTSGYFSFSRIQFREKRFRSRPRRKARQRSPSLFGSNNHPCRENTSSVNVANMGAIQLGCARFRIRALTSAGSPSSRLRPDMELTCQPMCQGKQKPVVRVGLPKSTATFLRLTRKDPIV